MKKLFITIALALATSLIAIPASAGSIPFTPQIPISDLHGQSGTTNIDGSSLGKYISSLYSFGFSIIGILATLTMMYGGLLYILAAGNPGREDDAKKWITSAISGIVLMLSTYVILNFVNPDLVRFRNLNITKINNGSDPSKMNPSDWTSSNIVGCRYPTTFKYDGMMTKDTCENEKKGTWLGTGSESICKRNISNFYGAACCAYPDTTETKVMSKADCSIVGGAFIEIDESGNSNCPCPTNTNYCLEDGSCVPIP